MKSITIPKFISKHTPTAYSGILATSIVYIGSDRLAIFLDNLAGSFTQRVAIGLPVIGNFSVKDLIVYAVVSKGFRYNVPTVIGFFANKFIFTTASGVAGIPKIGIPGFSASSTGSSATQTPGAINVSQGLPL